MSEELNKLLWNQFENPQRRDVEYPFIEVMKSSAFTKENFMKLVKLLGDSFLDYVREIKNYGSEGITVTIFESKADELKAFGEKNILAMTSREN